VDSNDSLDCTNDNEVILSLFSELFEFVSDLESELEASMDGLDPYCPLVATAPTFQCQDYLIPRTNLI
jgi:tetrahydromethanopterin S-methyltransferase subunit B